MSLDDKIKKCIEFIGNCVERKDSKEGQNEEEFKLFIEKIKQDHSKQLQVGFPYYRFIFKNSIF